MRRAGREIEVAALRGRAVLPRGAGAVQPCGRMDGLRRAFIPGAAGNGPYPQQEGENRLIEEKTKEPQLQESQTAQPRTVGQKLRSLWAWVECAVVRLRHRAGHGARHRWGWLARRAVTIAPVRTAAEFLYTLGFMGEYQLVRAGRAASAAFWWTVGSVWRLLRRLGETAFPEIRLVFRELFGPVYIFFRGIFNIIRTASAVRRERGLAAALHAGASYLARGIRRYAGLLPKAVVYLLPLGALGIMVTVVQLTFARQYALAVQVDGVTVGYVANEDVFDSAREAVLERINYAGADSNAEWTIEPTYQLAIADEVMDEREMTDSILRASGDEISEGTALYLDGELTAVCVDGDQLRSYLDGLLAPLEDPDDPNLSVTFNREVVLEDGIYFTESFQDYDDIISLLSGVRQAEKIYTVVAGDSISLIASKNGLTVSELCALNTDIELSVDSAIFPGDELIVTKEEAMLEVRVNRVVNWEESIPFTTERTSSSEYAFGTTKTVQEGEEGVRSVTALNTYDADGVLLEQEILSTEVVKEPVPRKIVTGTKLPSGSVAQVGNGTFIWPVPGYTYCSRWYSSGHKGVDICAAAGTPIYASASGVVTVAGYERGGAGTGYGNSLIINHGNGYSTLYAHCLSLVVSKGQAVSQGQLIGYVGNTGRSFGNHCHFEIRYNGKYLPPQNYFKK